MADKFTPEKRSEIMSQIKGKNTKPEVIVFQYLRKENVYFQKHYRRISGSPDIALPRQKKALFIDGDFWHGYTLEKRKGELPIYWSQKIIRNVKRDRQNMKDLQLNGWKVLRIWEHQLSKKYRDNTLKIIKNFLIN